ncbi:MAG: hypothetical protein R2716_03065 [Microthrixaceae bacterium]
MAGHDGDMQAGRGLVASCSGCIVCGGICAAALGVAVAVPGVASAQDARAAGRDGAQRQRPADSMGFQIVNAGASWAGPSVVPPLPTGTSPPQRARLSTPGALEALLGQPQCNGEVPPALDLDTLPPRSIADSNVEGSRSLEPVEVIYPRLADDDGPDRVVGTQQARADRKPSSGSTTSTRDQDFGFFRVEGATSSASTSFENGVRTAQAETTAERVVVLGGQVVFNEPRWTASGVSGADSGSRRITFRSARVFGNLVSGSVLQRDLAIFEGLVEGILSPLGVDIRFPEVRRPFWAGGIEMTPLALSMSDAPLGKDFLVPLLGSDLLRNYRAHLGQRGPPPRDLWTVIDALERALGGSGSVDAAVGGAVATTDLHRLLVAPFGEDKPPRPPPVPPPPRSPRPPRPRVTQPGFAEDFSTDLGTDFTDDSATQVA